MLSPRTTQITPSCGSPVGHAESLEDTKHGKIQTTETRSCKSVLKVGKCCREIKQETRIRRAGIAMLSALVRDVFPAKVHPTADLGRGGRHGDLREELSTQGEQQVQRPCGRNMPGVFNCKIASEAGVE